MYKETYKRRKVLVKALKKRQGVDLLFQEDIPLGEGTFTGYTQNGQPFFGEHILNNGDYYFGLFDSKGNRAVYGVRGSNGVYINGPFIKSCDGYFENDHKSYLITLKKGEQIKRKYFDTDATNNHLYLAPLNGAYKQVMPNIKSPKLLPYKHIFKYAYFGEVKDGKPFGYGVLINLESNHEGIIFGNWKDFENTASDDFMIVIDNDSVLVSANKRYLNVGNYSFYTGFKTVKCNSRLISTSPKPYLHFHICGVSASLDIYDNKHETAIFDKEIELDKNIINRVFYFHEDFPSIQFAFALAGNVALGDISLFTNTYKNLPKKAQLMDPEVLEMLVSSKASLESFIEKELERKALEKQEKKKGKKL